MYSKDDMRTILDPILGGDFQLKPEHAYAILEAVNHVEGGDRIAFMTYVLGSFGVVDKTDEVMRSHQVSEARFCELMDKIGSEASRAFHLWIKKNPTEDELASRLCSYLDRLQDDEERSVALSVILHDRHVPYCRIPDVPGPDELGCDYDDLLGRDPKEFTDGMKPKFVLVKNILSRHYLSPAVCALLWKVVRDCDPGTEQLTTFSLILKIVEHEAKSDGSIGGMLGSVIGDGSR